MQFMAVGSIEAAEAGHDIFLSPWRGGARGRGIG
jgi:hypothetical protein